VLNLAYTVHSKRCPFFLTVSLRAQCPKGVGLAGEGSFACRNGTVCDRRLWTAGFVVGMYMLSRDTA
jgi:hypothetical protein